MISTPEEIAYRVKAIQRRNPCYEKIAQWVGDLLSETVRFTYEFSMPGAGFNCKGLPDNWAKGQPLLDISSLSVDWNQAENLYRRLVTMVGQTKMGQTQEEGLLKALANDQKSSHKLMRAVLNSDLAPVESVAMDLTVDPSLLNILLRMSLRPALLKVAEACRGYLDFGKWTKGHCPVCGSQPILAELSGDGGKRALHCSLCETVWPYPRLCCPFCDHDNPEGLGYLRPEDEPGLRVDLCGNCGRYIKTIDLREIEGPVIAPLDDVATWHLDLMVTDGMGLEGES
jgi:FdhE protein